MTKVGSFVTTIRHLWQKNEDGHFFGKNFDATCAMEIVYNSGRLHTSDNSDLEFINVQPHNSM